MHFPNYRDFYQSKLIPIGPRDLSVLALPSEEDTPHWLIALEGRNTGKDREYFSWNIVIYKADENGYFNHKEPQFSSSNFHSFNDACKAVKQFTKVCMDDCLLSPKEQIS